ncbi:vacuolar membrane protein [Cryptococcus deuterogattii R265]|uniref:Vacuolar membrane protein n=1 Tax=Cryptococcus deuterogattii (strain R265) TaxID=294750 RepID=A0A095EB74_CRYD2|nr:vacuolar membrane protein [Cryptococcus deuterogattii R265]KIR75769.1 vacuolar membrane protein [Cryptococcus deuterogattii CA1014]
MPSNSPYIHILWACISSWYYGFHLSELNFPALSLTCTSPSSSSLIPQCLYLSESLYAFTTAIFTVGGLLGSLSNPWIVSKYGLKGGISLTGWINLFGAGVMTFAPHWVILATGRLVTGVSSGLAISLVPPYLSTIAKSSTELAHRSGQIGTMNQMAIVLGICSAQVAGLLLTGEKGDVPGSWRYVVFISAFISVLQILVSQMISMPSDEHIKPTQSPAFDPESQSCSQGRDEAASPLLPSSQQTVQLTLRQIISNPSLRGPSLLCAAIMALQQFSGINAVMFYSTPVLRPLLPTSVGLVSVGITIVNAIMTLPAIFLMDCLGRKVLILASIGGMTTTSIFLAIGLNGHHQIMSAISILAFVASFSIGLGPVPFLLTSELVPLPAVAALSSLAVSTNWVTSFLVAFFFLPLRDLLSSPSDPRSPETGREGEGRVFYAFTAILLMGGVMIGKGLKAN